MRTVGNHNRVGPFFEIVSMPEFLPDLSARVLDGMAHGAAAADLLLDLCLSFERQLPDSIVGVTILDRSAQLFEHAIFPSLADDYAAALRGILVADKPGSCALAVFGGKTVECTDVAFDGRFSPGWKQLGLKHGLRALISIPAVGAHGVALGTLVVTYQPGAPLSDEQRALADMLATLTARVLSYRQAQAGLELPDGQLAHPASSSLH
jgi:GAF domain-containing protein